MKNIYSIIVLLACLSIFGACTEDEKVVLQQPTNFILNTPKYVSGIYDLQNTETIQFTCTQPDYGFPVAAIYSVQISLTENFADYRTMPNTSTSAIIDVNASDMALAIVGLLGVEDENAYPTSPHPLYVRLSSVLNDEGLGQIYSNVITLPNVKGYFALDPLVMPENMYLIGNVAGNWDWNSATEMVPVNGNEGKFWIIQYLGQTSESDNAQIKFNTAKSWDGNEFGYDNVTIDATSATLAGTGENGGNIEIKNPGWYIVVVTTTISGRSFDYEVNIYEPNVYLQGPVNGGNWDTTDAAYRFTVPDLSSGADASFVSPAFTGASTGDDGGVRVSIKLPNIDWWRTEFMVFNNVLEYRGNGGDQEPRVKGSVGQKLYINFTKKTGKIE